MIAKILIAYMISASVIFNTDLSDDGPTNILQSLSSAIEEENINKLKPHFDEKYFYRQKIHAFFQYLFLEFNDLQATFTIYDSKEYSGLILSDLEILITGFSKNGGERQKIMSRMEPYWFQKQDGKWVIIGNKEKGMFKALEVMFQDSVENEVLALLEEMKKACEERNSGKFIDLFHHNFLHEGQTKEGLAENFAHAIRAGGLSMEFFDLSINERSATWGGWPEALWIDLTIEWFGDALDKNPGGFFNSGRTTINLQKSLEQWKIAGNGEMGESNMNGTKPYINPFGSYILLLGICTSVFIIGLFLSTKRKYFLFLSAAAIVCAGIIVCFKNRNAKPNLIIITVDTLRADHIGSYGYEQVETPFIDSLAKGGILFEKVSCPMPVTSPSHASLFTSLYPLQHGVIKNGWVLHEELETLAEQLSKQGYLTSAFISAGHLGTKYGFDQGFDYFQDKIEHGTRTAGETVRLVLEWLSDNSNHEFFMWIHLFDPHTPLIPPEPFKSLYKGPDKEKGLYRAEVAYTDSKIGVILDFLKSLNIENNTYVIFTSDHGESLGEHEYWGHASQLYEVTTQVPLIIKIPPKLFKQKGYISSSSRIKARIRLIDIFPTILDMLDIEIPSNIEGESFFPLMQGKKGGNSERAGFMQAQYIDVNNLPFINFQKDSVLMGRWKLIRSHFMPNELYDLNQDPFETRNIIDVHPEIRIRLTRELDGWKQKMKKVKITNQEIDNATREKLKALGYIY